MRTIPSIENAFLETQGGSISAYGPMADCPKELANVEVIDAAGSTVFPAFCDSHTHLVYADERATEWENRLNGLTYEQIAARGGGILNSVDKLRQTPENELFEAAKARCLAIAAYGTGAVEIKSGYGLDLESELKMLRVIKRLKDETPLTIKATFLAAHAVPREYKGREQDYVEAIVNEMLPEVAAQKLADFVDVFCDEGFFTVPQTAQILDAAAAYGIYGKIHANELAPSGGVELACEKGCLSADHLERMNDSAMRALTISQQSNKAVMPTALPAASFFLKIPYAPLRDMIDSGLAVALASDYNPGSAPSGNMQLVGTLACVEGGMLPSEALTASTVNSAAAMGLSTTHGRIAVGAVANICIAKNSIYYNFGQNNVETVILNGKLLARHR